ncbi:M20/M25/M40 family metallo-hydrolase [Maribellus sp. YY47]|uniref:M20/M25/M40 family metallo-hydrolase n=1 Tax=Maribellus sp. YY47 TaxID=2929486 RepID=UPI002001930A|nr:M20/M25/M40 family metallo-hydrolase [Maribellus sp. YY47]MCK3683868.1 M20/M25/M40 family metallo-hydrolase [Maribellus sp. YY47]
MLIQKTAFPGLFLLLFFVNAFGQHAAIGKIDTADLHEHLTYLASDELQGRRLGTPADGLEMAADYIVEQARKLGLKPGVPGYSQKVPLVTSVPDPESFIEITGNKGRTVFRTNDLIRLDGRMAKEALYDASIVMAGFGEISNETDWRGKVVILAQGQAKDFNTTKKFSWNNRDERSKIRAIEKKNPAAIIVVTSPLDHHHQAFNELKAWLNREQYRLTDEQEQAGIPVLVALPKLADKVLGGKGKFKKYLAAVAASQQHEWLKVEDKTISFASSVIKGELHARNIVGYVEGTDPELKNECVVFMAHYDHIGVDQSGEVYNGADDNGSGAVAIMEVAEAFASLDPKPKRSVVFLWVTCEELGMFGSTYYTQHPVFPLEKTVTCFNLDMVGRVFEPRDSIWNKSPKKVKDFDGLYTLSNNVWPKLAELNQQKCAELGLVADSSLPEYFIRASDHYNFHKSGVPILNYATGYHADYHRVGDEVDKINFEKIKRVAELCFLMGLDIANRNEIHRKTTEE